MKRSAVTEEYVFYTGKASEVVRQLALLGFALIWIFKTDVDSGPVIPKSFLGASFLLLVALTADFLQYAFGAGLWAWYDEKLRRESVEPDADVRPPDRVYVPSRTCFYAKLVALTVAYVW